MANFIFISENNIKKIETNKDFNYYLREIGKKGYILFDNKKFIFIWLNNDCKLMLFKNNKSYLIIFNNFNKLLKCDKNHLLDVLKYDNIIYEKFLKCYEFMEVFI